MDWDFFVQQIVNGLTLGSVYALIALGYTMIYGILKLLNFAHGEVYMMGAFAGFGILTVFGGALEVSINVVALILMMLAVAMVGSGLLGVAIERFAYRPLREKRASRIAPPPSHCQFPPNDRLQPRFLRGEMKARRAVDAVAIEQRDGRIAERSRPLDERFRQRRAAQE